MQLYIALFLMPFLFGITTGQVKAKRVVFFGDSITELGVKSGGYIFRLQRELEQRGISDRFELIGAGISGNKVYDLYLRLEHDVLARTPDIVVLYVGVNDVWHKTLLGTGTDPDKFERFYEAIIAKLKGRGIRVIACTPAVIGERTDNSNRQDGDLNFYSSIIRKLAAKHGVALCDLRSAFTKYNLQHNMENQASGILTTDRVHLNDEGNRLVAGLLLNLIIQE